MISFDVGDNRFHVRAGCIIKNGNRILFQKNKESDYWFLPGGRVEFNEMAEETIIREMKEEFNARVIRWELVWVIENFIEYSNRFLHEIAFMYVVELSNDEEIYKYEQEFEGEEEMFINRWIDMDELDSYDIIPEFVVHELKELGTIEGIKHIKKRSIR